ncbi:MAG: phosphatidate cytidylyltransferase [Desulfobacterota bacterium]|nr:phosphatidate cytidylyltransferase [Thermodesulfobacteriota bacterium]
MKARIERKKILTAILLIPPLIGLIAWGPPLLFALMVFATIGVGLLEFHKLALGQMTLLQRWVGIGAGCLFSLAFVYGQGERFPFFLASMLILLCLFYLVSVNHLPTVISQMGITLLGIFYVGFLLSHIILIRNRAGGELWVLFLVLAIWAGDICALFGGTLFGRHKLYPRISPNKTYEGFLSAILGSVAIGGAFVSLFLPQLPLGKALLMAIGLGILGQLGDLTESMLKRSAQVKDSGGLFPGHGGVLDRIDSFLFATPFFYYLLPQLVKETR